jgi:hypothetical protein
MKSGKSADMINVSVRANDAANLQAVASNDLEDEFDFIAGVHDDTFARRGIAQNRAIALQHAHGNHFVD